MDDIATTGQSNGASARTRLSVEGSRYCCHLRETCNSSLLCVCHLPNGISLQFQMRHLYLIIDLSTAMLERDLKPNRLLCAIKVCPLPPINHGGCSQSLPCSSCCRASLPGAVVATCPRHISRLLQSPFKCHLCSLTSAFGVAAHRFYSWSAYLHSGCPSFSVFSAWNASSTYPGWQKAERSIDYQLACHNSTHTCWTIFTVFLVANGSSAICVRP